MRCCRGHGAVGSIDYRDRHGECGVCRRTARIWRGVRCLMPVWARARLARRAHGIASDGRHHTLPRLPHGPRAVCVLQGVLQGSWKCAAGVCGEVLGRCQGGARGGATEILGGASS